MFVFFFFFFSLTNTKFLSGLAVHSHLSKQLSTKLCFFSHFEELDMRHSGELSWENQFLHLMGSWVMVKSGVVLCRDEHQQYLFMKWCLSFYERKENPRAMDTKVTLDLGTLRIRHFHSPHVHQQGWWPRSWAEEQRESREVSSRIPDKFQWNHVTYRNYFYLKESANLMKTCLFLSRPSWMGLWSSSS